ncbi:hypothetical protein Tco_0307528, partial [Tanacetum coccineum]
GRLRCKGVTKQIVGVIPKGLALRVVLVDHHSKDESGKGIKLEVNCDNRDLSRGNDYLILCAYEFGVKYSICSRVVIMEMKDVLHALLRQFLVIKDLALYDNESWNDPRDFAKPVKATALPQDVPSTSDRRLIELENQYCMEDPEQAFVEYASSRTDEAGVKGVDLGEEEAPYWTTLGKRESYKPQPSSDVVGAQTSYYARKDFLDCYLPVEWEISRDAELNPFKDTLVFRRMDKPPKNEDGAWYAKIRLIDPDGEEFTKTLQSIPTTRKLSERESPREIIDLDHFYDTHGSFFILDKLTEVAESSRLSDKIKVVFDQARNEEKDFASLMCDLYFSLRISLSKKCRLVAELEAPVERGDATTPLEYTREIVAHDSVLLGELEKLLARIMEMDPDIKNMTLSEYLEYEAAKERQLWDDVRSRRSPTNDYETEFNSFHRNKSNTFYYLYSHYLPTPPIQPYPKNYLVSTNESNNVENMTIAEYNLYVAKQGLGMNPLSNHSYGFTP